MKSSSKITSSICRVDEGADGEETEQELVQEKQGKIASSHLSSFITEKLGHKPVIPRKSKPTKLHGCPKDSKHSRSDALNYFSFLVKRTAMGEYIVPPGGRPLTWLQGITTAVNSFLPQKLNF